MFGFQRRVWWPKWTPAPSSSLMPTSALCVAPFLGASLPCFRPGPGGPRRAGPQPRLEIGVGGQQLDHLEVGPRLASSRPDRHSRAAAAVAPDRCVDRARAGVEAPLGERQVGAPQLAVSNLLGEGLVRLLVTRHDSQAREVLVEAMDV